MSTYLPTRTTFAVATLGGKVNQADSEPISEPMSAAGFVQRDFSEAADIYIVNTCTVTHMGDRSSRLMISQARRRHPGAMLVVTGCYAELNPQAVAALPGVNLVVGNRGKDALVEAIQGHRQMPGEQEQTSATSLPVEEPAWSVRPALPILETNGQHIGSDLPLSLNSTETEPQPDNPSRFTLVSGATSP